jgi:hypothetical protein
MNSTILTAAAVAFAFISVPSSAAGPEYWTNFAKAGDPNGRGLPRWPPYEGGAVARLADPVVVGELPDEDALRVSDQVYDGLR